MGRPEEGIASLERATELDPRSLIVANNLAGMLLIAGRDTEAIAACTPARSSTRRIRTSAAG